MFNFTNLIRQVALTMEVTALCQPLCFKFVSSWYQADLTVNQAIIECPTQLRWREVNSLTLSLLLKAEDSVSPKLITRDTLITTCSIGSLLHGTVFCVWSVEWVCKAHDLSGISVPGPLSFQFSSSQLCSTLAEHRPFRSKTSTGPVGCFVNMTAAFERAAAAIVKQKDAYLFPAPSRSHYSSKTSAKLPSVQWKNWQKTKVC